MPVMKGQERIVELLQAEGVDIISGIVDVHFMDFHRAAIRAGMKMVGTRHEVGSVMVAEAASRMLGKPQVAMAAYGPGAANMVGGVATAYDEHVPMIVLVSGRGFHTRGVVRNSKYQYWSQIDVFKKITKWSCVVQGTAFLDEVIREAFRQSVTGTPGPVYIEVPVDVMWAEAEFPAAASPGSYRTIEQQPVADSVIDSAAEMLIDAKLPVILAGQGIHISRTHDALKRIARILKCPVIPTFGGKGVMPENDPQTLMFGFAGANEATANADVVLAVGTSIGEPVMCGEPPRWGDYGKQKWIHVDCNGSQMHTNRFADVPVIGDLRVVLPQLAEALEVNGPFEAPEQLHGYRALMDDWRQRVADELHNEQPIHPGRAMLELRQLIPDHAVIVRDGGCTAIWELCLFEQRSNDFLWTSHTGHLGSGLPYAVGAQLAVGNERPVVLISGDGALGFQFMEFETAVRESLPICVVVNHDQHWGMELMDFYEGPASIAECPGTVMAPTRYDQMAEALGGHGEFVETIEELAGAMTRAFASGKPSIVQIMVDVNINANTLALPAVDEILSFYYLDGNKGYGHFDE